MRPLWPIPPAAREHVVARYPSGARSRSTFSIAREVVGELLWNEDGRPAWGWGLRAGKKHGLEVEWWPNGQPAFAMRYVGGLAHGVARHWDDRGVLLVRTTFKRGSGVDLWCDLRHRTLAEETHLRGNLLHGFLRRWNHDGRSVYREEHYFDGREHGVFREWNARGRLRPGFPRYFVDGARVDRRTYLRAARSTPTLPAVRRRDDAPRRALPPEFLDQPIARARRETSS